VIVSLALFFLSHIALRPDTGQVLWQRVDLAVLLWVLVAALALMRFKLGVVTVIVISALVGLGLHLL
jgi:chromate transporter